MNLAQNVASVAQHSLLAELPDIIIATPARASLSLDSSTLSFDNLIFLIIDEADLILSYGYDEDLRALAKCIPQGVQKCFMSATMSGEVKKLEGLLCCRPVVLELDGPSDHDGRISQHVVK